jgi:uncharacterized protein
MDLTHRFSVPAPVDEAWTAFNHLDRLAPCFPGATITGTSGDRFEGSIKIKLGPMALVFNGSGQFLERDAEARRVVFEAQGADRRGNGTASATVSASFVGNGSGTNVELLTDLDFTGRPAQFGDGVITDASNKLMDQFVSCVSSRFAEGLGAPAEDALVVAESVAADDELWEEWAESEDWAAEETESDSEQTLEMEAVGVSAPEQEPVETETPPTGEDSEPEPEPTVTGAPPPDRAGVVANVASTLRRYAPLLGFLSLALVIVIKIISRRRR